MLEVLDKRLETATGTHNHFLQARIMGEWVDRMLGSHYRFRTLESATYIARHPQFDRGLALELALLGDELIGPCTGARHVSSSLHPVSIQSAL